VCGTEPKHRCSVDGADALRRQIWVQIRRYLLKMTIDLTDCYRV
jgi:hypothetical protein